VKELKGLLAMMFLLALTIGCEILAMIKGWGLEPKSWWWIIGVGFFVTVGIRILLQKLVDEDKK